MKFTAVQFDPDKPYPESAWCSGPGQYYGVDPRRGSIPIGKGDWIVEFEMEPVNDQPVVERVVVSNTLYHAFFEDLKAQVDEILSPAEEKSAKKADDSEDAGKSGKSDSVAGKDTKSRK